MRDDADIKFRSQDCSKRNKMTLIKSFTPSISAEIEKEIDGKLAAIEAKESVRILFAIESGSRAWGFPSPDSDYDVRFVYSHEPDWYLSIKPGRDVIELPLEGDWDINGWDIQKALGLLLKSNPVMMEWLSSPIKYRWNNEVCKKLIDFGSKTAFEAPCLHHYRNLAQKQWSQHVDGRDEINLKKYFYILRPCLAISWIRNVAETPPPMNLQELVFGQSLSRELVDRIERLLVLKAKANEKALGARVPIIDEFIIGQLDWASTLKTANARVSLSSDADRLFRSIVKSESL